MFTFTQSVATSKNVSQGTHHVRKSSRPSPSVFPPTHLIVGARNCVRNGGRRPGFEAIAGVRVQNGLRTRPKDPRSKCLTLFPRTAYAQRVRGRVFLAYNRTAGGEVLPSSLSCHDVP